MRLKIAFVLYKYFPYGGLERDFLRIAEATLMRDHQVQVITTAWEDNQHPPADLNLTYLKTRGLQNHNRLHDFAQQVNLLTSQQSFDLIVGFNKMPGLDLYYAADTCFQAHAKTNHPYLYRYLPRIQQYIALEKAVFAKGKSTQILMIAHAQKALFQQYYQTEDDRFHLLPPGISRSILHYQATPQDTQALREALQLKADDRIVLMIASSFKTKGLDRALRAMAALSPQLRHRSHLVIIGPDNPAPYHKLANELKFPAAQCHFLGGRSDVYRYLHAAHVLIHPAYQENTGTVLLEALLASLPVLTVANCGFAFHIADAKAGIVLPAFNQVALNLGLETLLTQSKEDYRQSMQCYAKGHDLYSMPDKVAQIIEDKGRIKRETLS